MSSDANETPVGRNLRIVSELRDFCLSLGKARCIAVVAPRDLRDGEDEGMCNPVRVGEPAAIDPG